jgi:hypothetical protein
MPNASMSLCMTDCWLRLSHFKVTPDQFVSVTVAWSFLSSRQQTTRLEAVGMFLVVGGDDQFRLSDLSFKAVDF